MSWLQEQKKAAKRDENIVGDRLTPETLQRIGGIPQFPPLAAGFRPDGAWTHSYRIFACHGNVDGGNETVGRLRLERKPATAGRFQLLADQSIVHNDDTLHTLRATLTCENKAAAPLVEWTLSSRCENAEGQPLPEASCDESGRVSGGSVELRRKGGLARYAASGLVTSDWALFAALQQMPFSPSAMPPFDLLEGLSLWRPAHRIAYRGTYPWKGGGVEGPLHWFQQWGRGTLPYEYWLDSNHRLLVVTTLSRAYILDGRAEELLRERRESRLRRNRQRSQRKKNV